MSELKPESIQKLYDSANDLMAEVGCIGEITINTYSEKVDRIMEALFEIDNGCPDDEIITKNWNTRNTDQLIEAVKEKLLKSVSEKTHTGTSGLKFMLIDDITEVIKGMK